MYYRILIRRHPALHHYRGKGNQEDYCSCQCYPGPPRDAIAVLYYPVFHEIEDDGHRDDKGNHYIHEEYAHKSYSHLPTR